MKAAPAKEEPQAYIDCTGSLQVWRINDKDKILLPSADQSKFYTGDCYIFQYMYPGDDKEECLIGSWFGKKSIEVKFIFDFMFIVIRLYLEFPPYSSQLVFN
jgi:gelsolin